jgi:uncharacterized pyridoxamine 5'-phosphate oxidase family protein
MITQEVMDFVKENRVCAMATIEGDQPRVRSMMLIECDPEEGFVFATASTRDLYKQLKAQPKVEACFFEPKLNKMLRVSGEVEFFDDEEVKRKVVADSPCLSPLVKAATNPILTLFRITEGEAYFWTIENNTKEPEKIYF